MNLERITLYRTDNCGLRKSGRSGDVRPHGLRQGLHQGSEGHWDAIIALPSRPFGPCEGRWESLWYLSAVCRYMTQDSNYGTLDARMIFDISSGSITR